MGSAGSGAALGGWIATLGGASAEDGNGIALSSSGDIYITGSTGSQGAGGNDLLVAKYNNSGALQWQRTLGGSAAELSGGIALDSSNNVYIGGETSSQGAGSNDLLIAKYNSSGTIQFQRSLGGTASETAYAIAVDSSSNLYAAGSTSSQGAGVADILITKYNSSGTLQWQRSLGSAITEIARGVAVDSSANVYLVGYDTDIFDIVIAKYNTSGTLQWQRRLGDNTNPNAQYGYGIQVDSSANVYICGAASNDAIVAKYNTSGTLLWQRTLSGTSFDDAYSVAVDSSSNVYVCGRTISQGAGNYDVLLAKYNSSGAIQWQRVLGGTAADAGRNIAVDSAGSYIYIVGQTSSAGQGSSDVLIAKLPADGSLTGTYGSFTYQASTLTDAAGALTSATPTLTAGTRTLTDAARTLTDAACTLTSTTTAI